MPSTIFTFLRHSCSFMFMFNKASIRKPSGTAMNINEIILMHNSRYWLIRQCYMFQNLVQRGTKSFSSMHGCFCLRYHSSSPKMLRNKFPYFKNILITNLQKKIMMLLCLTVLALIACGYVYSKIPGL